MTSINRVRKTKEETDKEYAQRHHKVISLYNRLSRNNTQAINRNLLMAWMVKPEYDGGCGFENLLAADLFLKFLKLLEGEDRFKFESVI